ncbi:MAG: MAPEG family protein [Gammaproteobacteria bacterium]|nr:MAPEG family protein [Gammaproteobacteria bacterium]MBU1556985.1 MAPEG family protein [Gammaproteobacteria bacterium]MBU2069693.1 MAPEG family protein [Gammaproteobacteria bacterium]MBU2184558.1 MAPEG family protein [Gammaproteobacteria bacterium]MBU2205240.1 MAPEG family protein [Gammaproteobacteria bacterium]
MEKFILLPVFVQVLLTSVVMVLMGRRRIAAAKNKEISMSAFRTMNLTGANEQVIATSRNFDNQFQMPMLYFFSVLFTLQLGVADVIYVGLGAAFVLLRVVHTLVHVGSNKVRLRFNVFLLGCAVLWAIWLRLVWQVLAA